MKFVRVKIKLNIRLIAYAEIFFKHVHISAINLMQPMKFKQNIFQTSWYNSVEFILKNKFLIKCHLIVNYTQVYEKT